MSRYSPARVVAVQALRVIEDDSESLAGETLGRFSAEANLSPEDARLAMSLVFGSLRSALTLDFLYGRFLQRGAASKLDPRLRIILRVSAYQKYNLSRIPGYAIVNDAVEIGRSVLRLNSREIGFLNAVLRKIAADKDNPEMHFPQGNKASALSVRYAFPPDLVRLFIKKYGGQKAAEIMARCNAEPPLTVRTNLLRCTRDELARRLATDEFSSEPGILAPEALIVNPVSEADGSSLFESDIFREGLFYVQDEGSQMVAHIAAPFARGRILDLCSAPGGKTTHLAELTGGTLPITATDVSPRRLELVRENIARLGTRGIDVVPLENVQAGSHAQSKLFDLVLVDAPCSGLGTVRRNPEIRYRITESGLIRHQQRQIEVLENAAALTAPGGTIIYSTCSISDQENRGVVEQFLKTHPGWSRVDKSADHATWPAHPEIDGFEAAVLRRVQ